jgi:phage tail-like protein
MARPQQSDFLQNFRFHVISVPAGGGPDLLVPSGRPDAGFSAVGTPKLTIEAVMYKEGTMVYARKQPGAPSFEDISMSRGIARGDTAFWGWARRTAEGDGEYRVDMDIRVFHRAQALVRTAGDVRNTLNINIDNPAVVIHVLNAFPNSLPLYGEMDATSSEIAVHELGVTYETAYREDTPAT